MISVYLILFLVFQGSLSNFSHANETGYLELKQQGSQVFRAVEAAIALEADESQFELIRQRGQSVAHSLQKWGQDTLRAYESSGALKSLESVERLSLSDQEKIKQAREAIQEANRLWKLVVTPLGQAKDLSKKLNDCSKEATRVHPVSSQLVVGGVATGIQSNLNTAHCNPEGLNVDTSLAPVNLGEDTVNAIARLDLQSAVDLEKQLSLLNFASNDNRAEDITKEGLLELRDELVVQSRKTLFLNTAQIISKYLTGSNWTPEQLVQYTAYRVLPHGTTLGVTTDDKTEDRKKLATLILDDPSIMKQIRVAVAEANASTLESRQKELTEGVNDILKDLKTNRGVENTFYDPARDAQRLLDGAWLRERRPDPGVAFHLESFSMEDGGLAQALTRNPQFQRQFPGGIQIHAIDTGYRSFSERMIDGENFRGVNWNSAESANGILARIVNPNKAPELGEIYRKFLYDHYGVIVQAEANGALSPLSRERINITSHTVSSRQRNVSTRGSIDLTKDEGKNDVPAMKYLYSEMLGGLPLRLDPHLFTEGDIEVESSRETVRVMDYYMAEKGILPRDGSKTFQVRVISNEDALQLLDVGMRQAYPVVNSEGQRLDLRFALQDEYSRGQIGVRVAQRALPSYVFHSGNESGDSLVREGSDKGIDTSFITNAINKYVHSMSEVFDDLENLSEMDDEDDLREELKKMIKKNPYVIPSVLGSKPHLIPMFCSLIKELNNELGDSGAGFSGGQFLLVGLLLMAAGPAGWIALAGTVGALGYTANSVANNLEKIQDANLVKDYAISNGVRLSPGEIRELQGEVKSAALGLVLDGVDVASLGVIRATRPLLNGRELQSLARVTTRAGQGLALGGRGLRNYIVQQIKSGGLRTVFAPIKEATTEAAQKSLVGWRKKLADTWTKIESKAISLDDKLNPGGIIARRLGAASNRILGGSNVKLFRKQIFRIPTHKASLPLHLGASIALDEPIIRAAVKGIESLLEGDAPLDVEGKKVREFAKEHEYDPRYSDLYARSQLPSDNKDYISPEQMAVQIYDRHQNRNELLAEMAKMFDPRKQGPHAQEAFNSWMNETLSKEGGIEKYADFFYGTTLFSTRKYLEQGGIRYDKDKLHYSSEDPSQLLPPPTYVTYGLMMANYEKDLTQESISRWFVETRVDGKTVRSVQSKDSTGSDEFYQSYLQSEGGPIAQTLITAWENGIISTEVLKGELMRQQDELTFFKMMEIMPEKPRMMHPMNPDQDMTYAEYMEFERLRIAEEYGLSP